MRQAIIMENVSMYYDYDKPTSLSLSLSTQSSICVCVFCDMYPFAIILDYDTIHNDAVKIRFPNILNYKFIGET